MERKRLRRSDPGLPGTLRWLRRERGLSQAALGRKCVPQVDQPVISDFELGELWLTKEMAERFAPALVLDLWREDRLRAVQEVFRVWLKCVDAGCNEPMKVEAHDYLERLFGMSPGPLWKFAQGAGQTTPLPQVSAAERVVPA